MRKKIWSLVAVLLLVAAVVACGAEVGDECGTNAECGGEMICDLTAPGGYCTKTPCTPNSCPVDAVCISFPNGETYCMRYCDEDDDCRDGYRCVERGPLPYCYHR